MNRRFLLATLAALAGCALLPLAHANDDDVVPAPKILEMLNPKDVVLDRPGNPSAPARRMPSISLQVQFTFGSAELMPQGKRQLDQLAMALSDTALATAAFELAGHTDAVGDQDSNMRLSLERANSVRAYLVQVHGLNPGRLQTIGYGFSRLADPRNPTAAVNRRVEVRRLAMASRAGLPAPTASPAPTAVPAPGGRLVPTPR